MPHQHEIGASVRAGLLDRQQVGGRLDDAELTAVPLVAAAEAANRFLAQQDAIYRQIVDDLGMRVTGRK